MSAYVIEKGVPLPPKRANVGCTGFAAIVRAMEVGDSFVYPADKENTFAGQLGRLGKRLGRVFTQRKVDGAGIRVWRTA